MATRNNHSILPRHHSSPMAPRSSPAIPRAMAASRQCSPPAASTSRWGNSSLGGMTADVMAGLAYVSMIIAGPIIPLVLFFVEKNPFARFHAAQATLLSAGVYVVIIAGAIISAVIGVAAAAANSSVISLFGLVPSCLIGVVAIAGLVFWVMGMIAGFTGKYRKFPIIGDFAERMAGSQSLATMP